MAELEVDNLTLRFGGLVVLDGVSLAVERGELLALIGPNGAGKTIRVQLHQRHLSRRRRDPLPRPVDSLGKKPHDIAALGVARTFQHGELFPQMSVVDNLLTGRHPRIKGNPFSEMLFLPSVRREEIRQREAVEKIIEFVELERYRHTAVGGLPFGTQKIIGFARALANEPAHPAARRALGRPQPRGARGPRPLHPAHQAPARHCHDLDRT